MSELSAQNTGQERVKASEGVRLLSNETVAEDAAGLVGEYIEEVIRLST